MSRPIEELIFDRTQADIDNRTLKGEYRAEDLNRVETWCEFLADELNQVGYSISIVTKTDWTKEDMRTAEDMERIRSNIKLIMQGYYSITSIEANAEQFNFIKANNWEKILYEIYWLMFGMKNYYVYSGVCNSGQRRIYQNRFRHLYE